MGEIWVGESFRGPSLPKKSSKASSSQAPSHTKGNKDAYLLILPPSARGLVFVGDDQRIRYKTLSTRKTSEQKFWHADS